MATETIRFRILKRIKALIERPYLLL